MIVLFLLLLGISRSVQALQSPRLRQQRLVTTRLSSVDNYVEEDVLRALRGFQGSFAEVKAATVGLGVWRRCLAKGRVPEFGGLDDEQPWPARLETACRVFKPISAATLRYPRLIPTALASLVALSSIDEEDEDEEEAVKIKDWDVILRGIESLGSVFEDESLVDSWIGELGSVESGLWRHAGFLRLEELADRLSRIPELRTLVDGLGRRSSLFGKKPRLGAATLDDVKGSIGVSITTNVADDGFDGHTRGRSATRAVSSEKALLTGASKKLFYARYATSSLECVAPRGFDQEEVRIHRTKRTRLPRAPLGPIIVCLDTSHSMAGSREALAKATVLSAVRAANAQKRAVAILAFSGTHDLATIEIDSFSKEGMRRLLDFLACSFGGGTDVAAPLRRALKMLEGQDTTWLDADILIVTDGELLDPPVDEATFAALDALRASRRLRVCGLLACGSRTDEGGAYRNALPGSPLDQLCDTVETFLAPHDDLAVLLRSVPRQAKVDNGAHRNRRRTLMRAHAQDEHGLVDLEEPQDDLAVRRSSVASDESWPVDSGAPRSRKRTLMRAHAHDAEPDTVEEHSLVDALQDAIAAMSVGLTERDTEVRLALLGVLAQEHTLLLGPPGTAKSLVCRRLGQLFGDAAYFEVALTRFTTPDDIFGPLSLEALARDEYKRIRTADFAPQAEVLFLDEIFRAGALLPSLLTLLNERTWDDGAEKRKARLVTAVAATNELPEDAQLDALYDRFLLRRIVEPVSDRGLVAYLTAADSPASLTAMPALRRLAETPKALFPPEAARTLVRARTWLREEKRSTVSDRRLGRAVEMLRVVAGFHGRAQVGCLDLLLLKHVLWSEADHARDVDTWIFENAVPDSNISQLKFLLRSVIARVSKEADDNTALHIAEATAVAESIGEALADARGVHASLRDAVPRDQLFLTVEDLARARQHLAPRAEAVVKNLEILLGHTDELINLLNRGVPLPKQLLVLLDEEDDDSEFLDSDEFSSPDDPGTPNLTVMMDMSLTKKQAKSRLSPADYKQWANLRAEARR